MEFYCVVWHQAYRSQQEGGYRVYAESDSYLAQFPGQYHFVQGGLSEEAAHALALELEESYLA